MVTELKNEKRIVHSFEDVICLKRTKEARKIEPEWYWGSRKHFPYSCTDSFSWPILLVFFHGIICLTCLCHKQ